METNRLYYGDNLQIMRSMPLLSIDLVYLDPPFNSQQNYNLLYKSLTGKPVPEQAEAFCDTWEMDAQKEAIAKAMPALLREKGVEDYYVQFWRTWMDALRHVQPELMAYLIYMVQRLAHLKGLLKPTGSIYLHCDPAASHYIKVMMDGIFGHHNFRNEIVWKRTYAHGGASRWGDVHDTILFYTKSDKYTWNRIRQAHTKEYVSDKYRKEDERGRYTEIVMTGPGVTHGQSGLPWMGYNPTDAGRHWAVPQRAIEVLRTEGLTIPANLHAQLTLLYDHGYVYIPKKKGGDGVPRFKHHLQLTGQPVQDIILDIPPVNSQAKERLGYPTQKPIELMKRIIEASSNKGDVVFDPFCGCGTTIYAAVQTERAWVGCDIAILAIKLIREVLLERYRLVEDQHFSVDGIPASVEQAMELFKHDPFQFQHWAVERVGGFPMQKKVADRGIDGRLYFEEGDALKSMVLSVKGGATHPTDIRDLRGVLERERDVEIAGFISLREPSKGMRSEASEAGTYNYKGVEYPRIQLLSVREIMDEKREFASPTRMGSRIASGQTALPL